MSHNLDSILRLCSVAFWLDSGCLRDHGHPAHIINSYHKHRRSNTDAVSLAAAPRSQSLRSHARLVDISCRAGNKHVAWTYSFGTELSFDCTVAITRPVSRLSVAFAIFTTTGFEVASTRKELSENGETIKPGKYLININIPDLRLAPNTYTLNLGLKSEFGEEDFVLEAVTFDVVTDEIAADAHVDSIRAACIPDGRFTINPLT